MQLWDWLKGLLPKNNIVIHKPCQSVFNESPLDKSTSLCYSLFQLNCKTTANGTSTPSSDVQRAGDWCESGTCAGGEWPRELCPEPHPADSTVGGNGDSTVIWELDIQATIAAYPYE